jgi:hemolysin-activating ACP:hemolysin acyltransferase
MPANLLKQLRMLHDEDMLVACVAQALMSQDIAARIRSGQNRLKPAEWRSGKTPVIVATISLFTDKSALKNEEQTKFRSAFTNSHNQSKPL